MTKTARSALLLTLIAAPASGQIRGLPRARPEQVGLSDAALARVTPALRAAFVDSGRVPGFVVAVVRHGKLVLLDSAGLMDVEAGKPMLGSAVFRIASMTKPIAAVAMMQLVERGKVRLADPLSTYLPRFAQVKVAVDSGAHRRLVDPVTPITIEHLLTIRAGLATGDAAGAAEEWAPTIGDYADTLAELPLSDQPGSVFSYFSGAYDVLARVVEVVSGQRFDRYLETQIFTPLAMRETAHHVSEAMHGRIPKVYSRGLDGQFVAAPATIDDFIRPEATWFSGTSGLMSTVPDYLRFAQMLLNGGELDGQRVLQRSSVEQIMMSHGPAGTFGPEGWLDDKYAWGYGGVVRVDATADPSSIGTYRWAGGAWTFFWIDRKADLIGMIWAQVAPPGPEMGPFEKRFERLVYDAITRR